MGWDWLTFWCFGFWFAVAFAAVLYGECRKLQRRIEQLEGRRP